MIENLGEVKRKLSKEIFDRKIYATWALSEAYAAKALQVFRKFQTFNVFWTNRTNSAYNAVFSKAFSVQNEMGWFLAHALEYGVYLELANDRKHEALRPIVEDLAPDYIKALKRIWL